MHNHTHEHGEPEKIIPTNTYTVRYLDGPTPGYDVTDDFCGHIHQGKHTDLTVKNYPFKGRGIFSLMAFISRNVKTLERCDIDVTYEFDPEVKPYAYESEPPTLKYIHDLLTKLFIISNVLEHLALTIQFINFGKLSVNLDVTAGIYRVIFDPVKPMDLSEYPFHFYKFTYNSPIEAAKKKKIWGRESSGETGREQESYYKARGGFFYLRSSAEEKAQRAHNRCVIL